MSSKIVLFLLAFIIWVLLNWRPDWQHFLAGIFVSGLVTFMMANFFPAKFTKVFDPKRYLWALYYLPVFLWECIKANIDVAYRVAHPDLLIMPGIVKIKTELKSDLALTFLANSITLTPGTMCVDIDRNKGILYIHWIYVKERDVERATRIIAGKFERILKGIFE